MDTAQTAVTLGGLILIGFILWFFFGSKSSTAARADATGVQEIDVVVRPPLPSHHPAEFHRHAGGG